ncbi:MAG: IPT/TIG domain-containing protein [Terriglobales bacterium]
MKKQILVGLTLLLLALWGCGSPDVRPDGRTFPSSANAISISPTSVVAGSADVLLTITGSNFGSTRHNFSQAVWSSNGNQTPLATTFVSSTQLTAVVAANLLTSPVAAQVFVQTGDPMGDLSPRKSGSAGFTVTALPVGAATITAISPASATAGSSDITLTITGDNFDNQRFHTSMVGWSTNPTDTHCCNTWLQTTFVRSNELVAVIPAALLQTPVTAQVFVETGDPQGITDGVSCPRSNSITFTVGQ